GGVMRAVDDYAFVPSLKTRWPFDTAKAPRDRRAVDSDLRCTKRGNRKSRILFLMRSSERNWGLSIRFGHDFQRRSAFGGTRSNFLFGLRSLRDRNNGNAWFDNSSFFNRDFRNCFTQPFFVIQIDWRDHRNL